MGNTACCKSESSGESVDADLPGVASQVDEKPPKTPAQIQKEKEEAEAEKKRKKKEAEEARRQEEIRKEEEFFIQEDERKRKKKEEAERKKLEAEAAAAAPSPVLKIAEEAAHPLTVIFDDKGQLTEVTFHKRPLGFTVAVEKKKGGLFSKPSPTGRIMIAEVTSAALRTTKRVAAGMIVRKLNDQDIKEPITWDEFTAIFMDLSMKLPSDAA
eukprot:TRINITY_DN8388_c0_g2_i1.p1 TRINITY_DN8388_c0_g2~~TRINITY_DN8388_c0_g2_i1.p1  ORF type:complete len:213 (+),score=77.31 TRINITY_DN8388_c0_g2_i1:231-869(+)